MNPLRTDLGIQWTDIQQKVANVVLGHDWVLYQCERRNGTSFALCGLLATMCIERKKEKYVMYSPSKQKAEAMQQVFNNMTHNVCLIDYNTQADFVSFSDDYTIAEDTNLIIVDNADHTDPNLYHTVVVPHLQRHKCKLVMTCNHETDLIRTLEQLKNRDGTCMFHSERGG